MLNSQGLARPGSRSWARLQLGLAERLLRQVFRVAGRAGQAIGVAVQRLVMLLDQLLHGSLAAGLLHGEPPSLNKTPERTIYSPGDSARQAGATPLNTVEIFTESIVEAE